jgi:hypothetical protein
MMPSSNTHSRHGNPLFSKSGTRPSLAPTNTCQRPIRMIPNHAPYNSQRLDTLGISHETNTKPISTAVRSLFAFRSDLCHLSRLRTKERNTKATHVNSNTRRKEALTQKKLQQIRTMKSIYLQRT